MDGLTITNWLYICGGLILTGILVLKVLADLAIYLTSEPPRE